MPDNKYQSFKEFYPFYLSQHQNKICRLLHFIGTNIVLIVLAFAFYTQHYFYLLMIPVIGYGFAWIGHFFFEKNRPATFTYPVYSFLGDWVMWWQMITFRLK